MPAVTSARRGNRGPSAAPENRRALVAAAREVFAEQGIDAPLSAVARRAGVGQGSLYRHFPDRIALVLAAFDDNVAELEALAARPGTTLDELLDLVTRQIVVSVAFVEVASTSHDERLVALQDRVRAAFERPLRDARRDGLVRRSLRMRDLMLSVTMVSGAVASALPADREATARACWSLLRRGIDPAPR